MGVPKQINIFISLFFFDPLLTGAHSFDQLKRLPARHQVQVVVQLIFRHSGIFKSPRKSFTRSSSSPQSLFSTSAVLKAAGSNPHWSTDPQYWTAPRRKVGQESKVSWLKQKQQNWNKHWWSVAEGGLQVTQLKGERSTATTRLLPQPQVATTTRASSRELLNRTDGNSHTAVHHVSAHIVKQTLCLKLVIQILVYNNQTNHHIHRSPHFA